MSVHNLIKKIEDTGLTERRKGSGRPVTVLTEENASIFEELVCSQDCNPLNDLFQDRVQEKVYDGRYCYPLATIDELKTIIHDVWDECATNLPQIRKAMKQLLPRLEKVVDAKEGGSIKTGCGQTLSNKDIF